MKVAPFFKFLNNKIKYYDKLANNPFWEAKPIVLIWVEDDSLSDNDETDELKFKN